MLVTLIRRRLDTLLSLIEFEESLEAVLYTVLTWKNYRFTEKFYTFFVEEGFSRCESQLESVQAAFDKYVRSHQKFYIEYAKYTFASIFVMLLDFMPSQIRPILEVFFSGIKSYQQKVEAERERERFAIEKQ